MDEPPRAPDPITLVLVHGVGDAKRGAILAEFCDALKALGRRPWFRQENWFIGRFPYARLAGTGVVFAKRELRELVEVNWADVMRPEEGRTGVLVHLARLFFALRNLSVDATANPSPLARSLARVHCAVLELVGLWVALCTMGVMLLKSVEGTPGYAWAVTFGGTAILAGASIAIARGGRPRYWWGLVWAAFFLAMGVGYCTASGELQDQMVRDSARAYVASQALVVLTLNLAFFSTVLLGGGRRAQRAARGAYLWMPFVLITSLLVLLWMVLLAAGTNIESLQPAFDQWRGLFARSLPYNMRVTEMAMMTAEIFAFVVVPLFGLLVYLSSGLRRMLGFPSKPGEAAHSMVEVFLIAAPIAMTVCVAFALSKWHGHDPGLYAADNLMMMNTYVWSALRIPALLAFLLPGVRIVGDVAGDILFHIQPKGSEVSSREVTVERLKTLLEPLRAAKAECEVVVLAHSQGSVIAWTLLRESPELADHLVTVGSPLSTLYERFLGDEFQKGFALATPWHNFYRDGDYVGGAVSECPMNQSMGAGSHTDYWSAELFAKDFEACLSKPKADL